MDSPGTIKTYKLLRRVIGMAAAEAHKTRPSDPAPVKDVDVLVQTAPLDLSPSKLSELRLVQVWYLAS